MYYAVKNNWVLGIIIWTLTTGMGWGDELQQSIALVPPLRNIPKELDALSYSKRTFKYQKAASVSRQMRQIGQKIDKAIHLLPKLEETVIELLQNNDNLMAGRNIFLPIWGGIYANLPELTGKKDSAVTPVLTIFKMA